METLGGFVRTVLLHVIDGDVGGLVRTILLHVIDGDVGRLAPRGCCSWNTALVSLFSFNLLSRIVIFKCVMGLSASLKMVRPEPRFHEVVSLRENAVLGTRPW